MSRDDISSGLLTIFFQKKIRVLCSRCKKPMQATPEMLSGYRLPPRAKVFTSMGCDYCNMQGYAGGCVVHEAVHRPEDFERLLEEAQWRPTPSLRDDAVDRVSDGVMSFADLLSLE